MNKLFLLALAALLFASCGSDDDDSGPTVSNLTLNLTGLEELGSDYVYEGWLIVNEEPVSTGTFTSVEFPQTFSVEASVLNAASKFVLSIEPAIDSDPGPADTKIMAGDFSNNSAAVSSANLVGDFSSSTGTFILATPTDGADNNEESGVWFLDNSSGMAETGLNLPTLPDGWNYEGWVVIDGTPISTGTFTALDEADHNAATAPYKGTVNDGPSFPGEDYVMGSVGNINFPTDLRGATVVISVEPSPDNNAAPFTLKPLAQAVATDAELHTAISMGQGPVVEISGTATR